jgi:hypothetical protein
MSDTKDYSSERSTSARHREYRLVGLSAERGSAHRLRVSSMRNGTSALFRAL